MLKANRALLSPQNPLDHAALTSVADDLSATSGRYSARQFRWLILGAGFYVAWHLLGMALCTPSAQSRLAVLGSCVQTVANH